VYPGAHAATTPDKTALIMGKTGETLTYKELNDRSNRLAQLMWDAGLRPGDHAAIFMENNIRYPEIYWAAIRSGLYFTTVNSHLTAEEAIYIVNDSESQVLVTSYAMRQEAEGLIGEIPNCKTLLMVDGVLDGFESYEECTARYPAEPLEEELLGDTMLYSSGTTGRPKGIRRPLSGSKIKDAPAMVSLLLGGLYGIDENSHYLSPAPMYHSAPLGFSMGTQALGGTLIMMEKFDPEEALRCIETYKCTHSQWVPTMFIRMLKLPKEIQRKYDLSSLQIAVHAAAPIPVQVKQEMIDWWGPVLTEYYAGTELNGFVFVHSPEWLEHPGTVGKPVLGKLHICDDDGNELPTGEAGIIYFELPNMPFEYHNSPEKTKDAQHPAHANWSTLGDVGRLDEEGYLYLTDRKSFMIISGGVNIYPVEIENALVMHPKVADVAVFGVPNKDFGEEVKAVIQPAEGIESGEELTQELLAYCREHIAHYKCPRSIDFREQLPRLPTGKLYKRLLRDEYWGKKGSKIV